MLMVNGSNNIKAFAHIFSFSSSPVTVKTFKIPWGIIVMVTSVAWTHEIEVRVLYSPPKPI